MPGISWLTLPPGGMPEPFEVKDSLKESWDVESFGASVDLKVPYASARAVLENILQNERAWPYPNSFCDMFALNGGLKPFSGKMDADTAGGHGSSYKYAILSLNFGPLAPFDWGIGSDPGDADNVVYFTEAFEPTAEFMSMPGAKFKWISDDKPLTDEEAGGRLVHSFDYTVNFTGILPGTIPSGYFEYGSHVNSDTSPQVSSARLGKTFAAGTLLYNGAKLSGKKSNRPSEDRLDMTCRWTYRKEGWNRLWRAKTNSFDTYYEVGSIGTPYDNYPPVLMAGMVP